MTVSTNPFAAVDPTLGYLYQVRLALLWSLRRLRSGQTFQVSIEVLDDVAFEPTGAEPRELIQAKHHSTRVGGLGDASPDIWKTLRVWIVGRASGRLVQSDFLCLVTTGSASAGSAASHLKTSERDVAAALTRLDSTAASSTNADNAAAYSAYKALTLPERQALLERVTVIDAAPTVVDLDQELRQEVFWAVERRHQQAFLDRLEGWWFRRAIQQLTTDAAHRIGSVEIEAYMAELREQFKQESLPIDEDLLDFALDDETAAAHAGHTFVKQIELVAAGKRRIASAIRDYYRAYEQRSRWLREDLVVGLDLRRYEKRLAEEWGSVFDAMEDELGAKATEDAKRAAARRVLAWAEGADLPIRQGVTAPFLCRGSLHMLADELRIGWHPDFAELLAGALAAAGTEL